MSRNQTVKKALPVAQTRRNARQRALQGLYQHELNPQTSRALIEQLKVSQDMSKTDVDYFAELLKQIITTTESLDQNLIPYLDIPIERLDAMERCVLRIAIYELTQHPEIPFRVILNEAISLAKKFGAEDGHKFVNGVLDKAVIELRAAEKNQ